MAKSKKQYSAAEKKAFKQGLFAGLRRSLIKKNSNNTSKNTIPKRKKWFSFLAFNDNCDVFNVDVFGSSRSNALKQARSKLKRDPEMPCWGVSITNDIGNKEEYYRTVTIDDNIKGGISDNWKRHYRDSDDAVRAKYGKDLSKPLKK